MLIVLRRLHWCSICIARGTFLRLMLKTLQIDFVKADLFVPKGHICCGILQLAVCFRLITRHFGLLVFRFAPLAVVLALAGCQRSTDVAFTPPAQHAPTKLAEPSGKNFIAMRDPDVSDYIVRDVSDSLEGGGWRWTFDRPELRYRLTNTENLRLEVDFAIAGATLKDTGPVTVSFFVNGRPLGSMKCGKAADYKFTKAVPAQWLKPGDGTLVAAEARPLWNAPDGKHLGFILTQEGFVRDSQ
jgi:hypothetical protein